MTTIQREAERFAFNHIWHGILIGSSELLYYYKDTYPWCKRGLLLSLASGYITIDHSYTKIGDETRSDSMTCYICPTLKALWAKDVYDRDTINELISQSICTFKNVTLRSKQFGIEFPWLKHK